MTTRNMDMIVLGLDTVKRILDSSEQELADYVGLSLSEFRALIRNEPQSTLAGLIIGFGLGRRSTQVEAS